MGRLQVQTEAVTFKPDILREPAGRVGYIASGAYSVSMANVHATGTARITGSSGAPADLGPGESITFAASESNGTIGRIDYNSDTGELLIITLRK